MLVRHVMTRDVLSVSPDEPCLALLQVFAKERIRRAPVVEDGRVVAMVTRDDLLRLFPATHEQLENADARALRTLTVRSAMSKHLHGVAADDHLERAADLMRVFKVGGLPVLEHGVLLGLLTESDLFRVLAHVTEDPEVLRITAEGGVGGGEMDLLRLCAGLGVQLVRYTQSRAPAPRGGTEEGEERALVHVVHVRGRDRGELLARMVEAGWVLLDVEPAMVGE